MFSPGNVDIHRDVFLHFLNSFDNTGSPLQREKRKDGQNKSCQGNTWDSEMLPKQGILGAQVLNSGSKVYCNHICRKQEKNLFRNVRNLKIILEWGPCHT